MNQLFGDLVDVYALIYLDDILIFSYTKEKYQKHIYIVFDRLVKFKYHVKCKRCELFSKKIKFLGHTISVAGICII